MQTDEFQRNFDLIYREAQQGSTDKLRIYTRQNRKCIQNFRETVALAGQRMHMQDKVCSGIGADVTDASDMAERIALCNASELMPDELEESMDEN
jgi:hypothetical protein